MNTGWKIWFALLIIAALYGLVMINDAEKVADVNEASITGAPQQSVVALWQLNDMAAIIVYELIVTVVAIASIGLFLISRHDPPLELEEAPPKGNHIASAAPDD